MEDKLRYTLCCVMLSMSTLSMVSGAAEHDRYGIGQPATAEEIAAWDTDVKPSGEGLPAGQGTPADGEIVYQEKCQQCHGVNGVGGPYGSLVGRLPDDGFPFAYDPWLEKTIGNYWPYATTLFDYLRRAMPYEAPGSLSINETYSLVAYLLQQNAIIEAGTEINQDNLAAIKMPARDRFVPDNRRGGDEIR